MKPGLSLDKNIILIAGLLLLAFGVSFGAELEVRATPLEHRGVLLVPARDLEASGIAKVTFEEAPRRLIFVRENVRLEIVIGSINARLNGVEVKLPGAVEIVEGRAMVPALFIMETLGLPRTEIKPPSWSPPLTASRKGRLSGRVLYNGRPLAGIVLRLVRAEDFSFVPELRATTDKAGNYGFASVPEGAYRVYAYVGDNPDYFNRVTPTVQLGASPALAEPLHMGRVLSALDPPLGAILSPDREMVFTWSECPQAAVYHISVVDPETREEVFTGTTRLPRIPLPVSRLRPGRLYEWHITATDSGGGFLGGSPGAGAEALNFSIAID
jgi:hypothetical protein